MRGLTLLERILIVLVWMPFFYGCGDGLPQYIPPEGCNNTTRYVVQTNVIIVYEFCRVYAVYIDPDTNEFRKVEL